MKRLAAVVACAVALLPGAAAADPVRHVVGAFAADRFTPAPPGDPFLAVAGSGIEGEQLFRASMAVEDAVLPLIARKLSSPVIKNELVLHTTFSAAIWNRFLLYATVPFVLVNAGSSANATGVPRTRLDKPDQPDIADVVAGLRFRAYSTNDRALETGFGVTLWSKTGRAEAYTGDGDLRAFTFIGASGQGTHFAYATRVGPIFQQSIDFVDIHLGPEIRAEAAAAWMTTNDTFQLGPEILFDAPLGGGTTQFPTKPGLEVLASTHYRIGDIVLGAFAGPGILRGPGTPAFRGMLSVAFAPRGDVDTDRDGVPDRSDACPRLPGVSSDDRETDGCPSDRDDDGIADAEDACPDEPGVASQDPKKNGCPRIVDRDHDGIPDGEDACPDKPGKRDPEPRKNGCPPDRDNDGIADADDACPDVSGVDDKDPKKRGCPKDTDGDGIPDAEDACPAVKGVKSADPKKNGCPAAP